MEQNERMATESEASLEQLREILFGDLRRELERRLAELDARIEREMAQLRENIEAAVEPLERFGREEIQAIGARLREQEKLRIEALRASEERAKQLLDELRGHAIEQIELATDQIRRREDAVLTQLKRALRDLDQRKMDKAALAGLFSQSAASVGREVSGEEPAAEEEEAPAGRHH